jgi:tetratricopeptide (TPR) repeat protein
LHRLADALRLAALAERLPERQLRALAASCRALWEARDRLARRDEHGPDDAAARQVRDDLLDLAVLCAELLPRLADGEGGRRPREEALAVLAEAERLFGPNAALLRVRRDLAADLGQADVAREAGGRLKAAPPRSAWEQCALGRALLRAGDVVGAAAAFERAVALEPTGYWGHFGQGRCAFRRDDYRGAEAAFRVCVALAPGSAAAWHNRGLALDRLGDAERALADYDRALELEPGLAEAALNRAALRHRLGRHKQALADVRRALDAGADPAAGHYLAGRIEAALGDRAGALASLGRALAARPGHPGALALSRELQTKYRGEKSAP